MLRLVNKILLLSLLLVMPIQGIAASVSHMLCAAPPAAGTMDMGHQHDGAIAAHEHDHGDSGNNDSSAGHAGHLSCHQLSSALPSVAVTIFASNLPVFVPTIFVLPSLFFPEQLQRPPLA